MMRLKVSRVQRGKQQLKKTNAGKRLGSKKRKPAPEAPSKKPERKIAKIADEEISSDSDSEHGENGVKTVVTSSDEEDLTEQERRLKLAKKYLSKIEDEELEGEDAISHRLRQDVLKKSGQLQRKLANECQFVETSDLKVLKGHRLSVTCLVVSNDGKYSISASKDGAIIKWCLQKFVRLKVVPGVPKANSKLGSHYSVVTSLALTSDSKFLASGDESKRIQIWNPEDLCPIHEFTHHRKGITGLAFRLSTHQLFSSSEDRSVKIWNLDEMAYVETLFGHQDSITSIDSLVRDHALTSGGRDCTVRLWKIPDESQLVFQGGSGSIDCVSLINEQHFLSGADDGSISLWGLQKKKPLASMLATHGKQSNGECNWITALTALPNTDLVASGSNNGFVCVWKCKEDFKGLVLLAQVPVVGFVNGLKFSHSGEYLLAAVGQEHRCGRWWRIKEAKNSVVVIPLRSGAL